jgi:hypothetical protein
MVSDEVLDVISHVVERDPLVPSSISKPLHTR